MADFADRSLGVGYAGGTTILFVLLTTSLFTWYRTLGSVAVNTVKSPKSEVFYWITIMFSQTLGTALGDWLADDAGLGYGGSAMVFSGNVGPDCSDVLLDEVFSHFPLLGSLHPHSSTGRGRRRFLGQAAKQGRARIKPLLGVRGSAHNDLALHLLLPSQTCQTSTLRGWNAPEDYLHLLINGRFQPFSSNLALGGSLRALTSVTARLK